MPRLGGTVETASIVSPFLAQCLELWRHGSLKPYDLVGIYLLSLLSIRRPRSWCTGRLASEIATRSSIAAAGTQLIRDYPTLLAWLHPQYLCKKLGMLASDIDQLTVVDLFNQLRFNNVKENSNNYVNKCIVGWCLGSIPFQLMFYVPSSMEVLHQQSIGERVITIFTTEEELSRTHVSKLTYMSGNRCHERDPLEFALHDMKHMEHFVAADTHLEQVGFFRCLHGLSSCYSCSDLQAYFLEICRLDAVFWSELEYVISDMNCYSTHLLRYLYAKVFEAVRRGFGGSPSISSADKLGSLDAQLSSDDMRSAVESLWSRILLDMGMLQPVLTDALSAGGVVADGVDVDCVVSDGQCCSSAYASAMALVQVSYRERAGWTAQEGDCIRSFFKSMSHHLVTDEESMSHLVRDEDSMSDLVRDEESMSHLVRDEESMSHHLVRDEESMSDLVRDEESMSSSQG